MFTAPPTIPTNNQESTAVHQADTEANTDLRGRFPGWTFLSGQYYANGDPYMAHIRDREGRIWTVYFGMNDQITRVVQGDQ